MPCLQGAVDTSFIAKHEGQLLSAEPAGSSVLSLAAVTFMQAAVQRAQGVRPTGLQAAARGPLAWRQLNKQMCSDGA